MADKDSSVLDAIIGILASNKQFDSLQQKNWDAVSNMIPGSTPYQCQKRYKELKLEMGTHSEPHHKILTQITKMSSQEKSETKDDKISKENAGLKSSPSSADVNQRNNDQGPIMVIHVCDEAKSVKQDFSCARDLLIKEMKYFAEYLTTDSQRWEDVDISVHCDVHIFDWLMKYAKRGTKEFPKEPELETVNVISILISSDFLKMDSLTERCIIFCHKHMNAILATPCNMNCISDKLVARISSLFSHNEIEELKDRKDKFRSKLFAKKVEKLFEADNNETSMDSPNNASTLYRCKDCGKLLNKTLEKLVKCIPSRMLVGSHGELVYIHDRDPTFDINDYLVDLKSELKTWRDVYWRLWGTVNYLQCTRCNEFFACKELSGCRFHKDRVVYQSDSTLGKLNGAVGTYLCCGLRVARFDPTQENLGCVVQDHVIFTPDSNQGTKLNKVADDLLRYRDSVVVPVTPTQLSSLEINVFANDECASGLREDGIGLKKPSNILKQPAKSSEFQQPRLQALTHEILEQESNSEHSDDEVGDDEVKPDAKTPKHLRQRKTQITVQPAAILVDGPEFAGHHRNKWDISRSVRFNQDAQRQEDVIRFREMVSYLTRLRLGADKLEKYKHKDYAGGMYPKIEAQWKASLGQGKPSASSAPKSSRAKASTVKGTS